MQQWQSIIYSQRITSIYVYNTLTINNWLILIYPVCVIISLLSAVVYFFKFSSYLCVVYMESPLGMTCALQRDFKTYSQTHTHNTWVATLLIKVLWHIKVRLYVIWAEMCGRFLIINAQMSHSQRTGSALKALINK